MRKFEQGDVVKLSKAGRKYVRKLYKEDVQMEPDEFPLGGELGVVSNHFDDDDAYTPGLVYVEWSDYADYLKPKHLLLGTEYEFPTKIPAYEVRIGDVVKDFEGDKMRVNQVVEDDDGTESIRFTGLTVDGGALTFMYKEPRDKVKVFSREYK